MSVLDALRGDSYSQDEFFSRFVPDLRKSQHSIKISTGFVSRQRVTELETVLSNKTREGVVICVFIGQPKDWHRPWDSLPPSKINEFEAIKACVSHLRSLQVHVTLRPFEHTKLAIIDHGIIWDGSLNILSYYKSSERMTRWYDPTRACQAIRQHQLDACPECQMQIGQMKEQDLLLSRNNIPGIIQSRRQQLGLSQTELSAKAGIDRKSLIRIENGNVEPSFSTLHKIFEVLGRSMILLPPRVIPNVVQLVRLEYAKDTDAPKNENLGTKRHT
jgi:DNA-binding XRE family transcriptional regulator